MLIDTHAVGAPSEAGQIVETVLREGEVVLTCGRRKPITGGVSLEEASRLAALVEQHECRTTVETGVAFGISTLALCAALRRRRCPGAMHVGIDPDQYSRHEGAALLLLRRFGLSGYFRLEEGPTHLAAARLLEEGFSADLAFIDGFHTFDYTLVDFFFLDKMLPPGGLLVLHDLNMPSQKKVLRFILGNRHYEVLPPRRLSVGQTAGELLRCLKHRDALVGPVLARMPRMIVLRKLDCWEPPWHYFQNF